MATWLASCSCGGLRVTCEGEPMRVSMCHCTECQRRTGSTYGAQARWPRERVTIEGPSTEYVRVADSGNKAMFHFCPACGTTVWYRLETQPDVVAVALGAFADKDFPAPKFSVYEDRRHPWVSVPAGAERHD
ncbi:MAG TPA: GFA family protein [Rhizomicrobium sp.]